MRVSYAIGNTCNDKIFLLLKSDSYLSSPQIPGETCPNVHIIQY